MKKPKKPAFVFPPPELGEAYVKLGIRMGAEDFTERMEALQYIIDYNKRTPIHENAER